MLRTDRASPCGAVGTRADLPPGINSAALLSSPHTLLPSKTISVSAKIEGPFPPSEAPIRPLEDVSWGPDLGFRSGT